MRLAQPFKPHPFIHLARSLPTRYLSSSLCAHRYLHSSGLLCLQSRQAGSELASQNSHSHNADHGSANLPPPGVLKELPYNAPLVHYYEKQPYHLLPLRDYKLGDEPLEGRVLILDKLCGELIENDFRQLIPEAGEYIRVFPNRDPATLEKNSQYIMVFNDPRSALLYKRHIEHVYELVRKHKNKRLDVKHLDLPPDFRIKGENVSRLIDSFTLVPNTTKLYAFIPPSIRGFKERTIRHGGFSAIVSPDRYLKRCVLLRVTGVCLKLSDLLIAIAYDGRRRNLMWGVKTGSNGIFRLGRHGPNSENGRTHTASDAREAVSHTKERIPEELRIRYGDRWLVDFNSYLEAQRFARAWNKRPFPFPPAGDKKWTMSQAADDVRTSPKALETMVHTEVLW